IPATGRRYGLVGLPDLHDPVRSIEAAARYLSDLNQMFDGRIDLVLAGYNTGENAVVRSGYRVPRYKESIEYVAQGISILRHITDANIFLSRNAEKVLQTSQTRLSLSNSHLAARRPDARPRFQPTRSIYFRLR